jgi:hypothetical protein
LGVAPNVEGKGRGLRCPRRSFELLLDCLQGGDVFFSRDLLVVEVPLQIVFAPLSFVSTGFLRFPSFLCLSCRLFGFGIPLLLLLHLSLESGE